MVLGRRSGFLLGFGKNKWKAPSQLAEKNGEIDYSENIPKKYTLKKKTIPSLKLTANAPENRPSQKEISSSNHPFFGCENVSFRGCICFQEQTQTQTRWESRYPGWCLTPTLLLICSSFNRENGYPLLICSSLSTAQVKISIFTELELELQKESPKGWLIHGFVPTVTVALSIKIMETKHMWIQFILIYLIYIYIFIFMEYMEYIFIIYYIYVFI